MIKKQYVKSRDVVKLTFEVPPDQLPAGAKIKSVSLVGEFNDWNPKKQKMEGLKNGKFKTTLEVDPGSTVRFRYLADGEMWFNDWAADEYQPGTHGTDDCIVIATA